MKTYILKLITLSVLISSCTDEELLLEQKSEERTLLDPSEEIPSSIIIDDFDEDKELNNTAHFTYSEGNLVSVVTEYPVPWTSSIEYSYQNSLVEIANGEWVSGRKYSVNYEYDDVGRITAKEFLNIEDSTLYFTNYEYVSDIHIINENSGQEVFLNSVEPFQIDKIIQDSLEMSFSYIDGFVSTIEHRNVNGELIKLEEFEYLDKEVKGAYNKSKFLYGPEWKLNSLLLEGYSHQLEESYISKHIISITDPAEWTFSYEFDSLERVSNQYLSFEATDRSFSCMTYYNY